MISITNTVPWNFGTVHYRLEQKFDTKSVWYGWQFDWQGNLAKKSTPSFDPSFPPNGYRHCPCLIRNMPSVPITRQRACSRALLRDDRDGAVLVLHIMSVHHHLLSDHLHRRRRSTDQASRLRSSTAGCSRCTVQDRSVCRPAFWRGRVHRLGPSPGCQFY